jgi:hypothetical protein
MQANWLYACGFDFTDGPVNASSIVTFMTPTPPTGLSTACSSDGTQATFSWVPTVGSDRFYLRVGPPTNLIVDGYTAASYTFPVIPGQTYTWWVHGGNAATASTDANIETFSCNGN